MSSKIGAKEKKKTSLKKINPTQLKEHIVEIVSDSGEGAQKCGQSFGSICAKMGNGVWTVEIIPAEIQPPPRMATGASGNRIRFGSFYVTNAGDKADLVVAFNEQVLVGRIEAGSIKPGATILLENMWRNHRDPAISSTYQETYNKLIEEGYNIKEIPMEEECLKYVLNPRRGKNMFVLGILCSIYSRDLDIARAQVKFNFAKKGEKIISDNIQLFDAGYEWAEKNLDFFFDIPANNIKEPQIVVNGNTALALGIMASGMETCAMYPITPATSASHYLSEIFENVGGVVHQAEDEISACAFAIGSSYAGKCACTITSGPGMALKTELIGLASMAEIPLVIINVQRGGPSTGLPTKVEQGDLLAAIFSTHGDAPKIVFAVSNVEDCFYSVITARQIAETFRMPVIILSDTNLATGQQPIKKPKLKKRMVGTTYRSKPGSGEFISI
jgi:2-oxoglutarate ferredoxin oxidoreductase subunit alpha